MENEHPLIYNPFANPPIRKPAEEEELLLKDLNTNNYSKPFLKRMEEHMKNSGTTEVEDSNEPIIVEKMPEKKSHLGRPKSEKVFAKNIADQLVLKKVEPADDQTRGEHNKSMNTLKNILLMQNLRNTKPHYVDTRPGSNDTESEVDMRDYVDFCYNIVKRVCTETERSMTEQIHSKNYDGKYTNSHEIRFVITSLVDTEDEIVIEGEALYYIGGIPVRTRSDISSALDNSTLRDEERTMTQITSPERPRDLIEILTLNTPRILKSKLPDFRELKAYERKREQMVRDDTARVLEICESVTTYILERPADVFSGIVNDIEYVFRPRLVDGCVTQFTVRCKYAGDIVDTGTTTPISGTPVPAEYDE